MSAGWRTRDHLRARRPHERRAALAPPLALEVRVARAAIGSRPVHVVVVPARPGEGDIPEKDAMEVPVLTTVLAAHVATSDDSPDFHALNQSRPPMVSVAMAAYTVRDDTMPTQLADISEAGVLTTLGRGHRFPVQRMDGYEIMALARGPPGEREKAVVFAEHVAGVYGTVATETLYHEDDDAAPSDAVTVVLLFEVPEMTLDQVLPGLRDTQEFRSWIAGGGGGRSS